MLLWLLNLNFAGGQALVVSGAIPVPGQPDIGVGCPPAISVNYEAEITAPGGGDIGV